METILTLVVGALIGAAATYLLTMRSATDIKGMLYDQQLVNKFLKEYLNKSNKPSNGKRKYYKNKRSQKARTNGNKVAKPSIK
jgi:uncharacterized protein YaiI (UPF0178 family)